MVLLDIRLVRENPELVKKDLARRRQDERIAWVDELLELDKKWRSILQEANQLREQRNRITEEIADLKKKGRDTSKKLHEAEQIPEQIKGLEAEAEVAKSGVDDYLRRLPNTLRPQVPYGESEEENVEIRRWGQQPKFSFKPLDHIDLGLKKGLIELDKAAEVAGKRFYYLRGDLVRLNYALIQFGLDFLREDGFQLFQTPYMLRRDVVEGATDFATFEDAIYEVKDGELCMIPTAEYGLLAYHRDEIIDGKLLPLRYGGISPCFRKEAGAHGRDTKGIFRVHQFEKVEQFIFCRPEESDAEHERLIANAERYFQILGIPHRIVEVCTGDIGSVAARKLDLETWLPGQGKYREAVSCSNCTSYQAVRSKIRFRDKPQETPKYVHTLNSTLVATERALVTIMENFQQEDGTILVPEALRPYLGGLKTLE